MATTVGTVIQSEGTFLAQAADGSIRELKAGDIIHEGDLVFGAEGNVAAHNILVALEDGRNEVLISGTDDQLFDATLQPVALDTLDVETDATQIAAFVDAYENIDEIETAAGDEVASTASTEDVTGDFQQHIDNVRHIEAKEADIVRQVYEASDLAEDNEIGTPGLVGANAAAQEVPQSMADSIAADNEVAEEAVVEEEEEAAEEEEVAATEAEERSSAAAAQAAATEAFNEQAETDLQPYIDAANAAAADAKDAQNAADAAKAAADADPTPANLAAAETAQSAADDAAQDAQDAAAQLQSAINDVTTQAAASGYPVPEIVTEANSAANGARSAASSAEAAADQSEAATDAEVADLLAAANQAADDANDAIADAEAAAAALAANTNPSAADIQAANDAIAAADAAIAAANTAATTYSDAATAAGETVESTTAVGSTTDASTTVTDAVAAEQASDAQIATMLNDIQPYIDAANQAASDAADAKDAADAAKATADANPTPANLEAAEAAQAVADAAAADADAAAAALDSEAALLSTAATAAGEDVSSTLADATAASSAATTAADNAEAAADQSEAATDAEVADLLAAANQAADDANDAIADAEAAAAALAANTNPSAADIQAANDAIAAADQAIADAAAATTTYQNAATAADETVENTTAVGTTTDATTTVTNAVAAETASDSNVADLLAAANQAADDANDAIADAEAAAAALAANTNPSAADIQAANDAIAAADAAIAAANTAATTYSDAATAAGETVESTTAVGSTTDASTTVTDAVAAETASDAQIATIVSDLANLVTAANTAATEAQDAADAADAARETAETTPTAENVAAAEAAQDAAATAADDANAAAAAVDAKADELQSAATAQGEDAATEIAAARTAADSADTASDTANTAANAALPDAVGDATITIDTIANDNIINAVESGNELVITGDSTNIDAGNNQITVTLNGKEYKGDVAEDGSWSVTVNSGQVSQLSDGNFTITADAIGSNGNPATQGTKSLTVDTTIEDPTGNLVDGSDTTNDNTPTINGTGEPGSIVVLTNTNTGRVLAETVIDDNGNYSVDSRILSDGDKDITITTTDLAGNESTGTMEFTVDTNSAPVISSAIVDQSTDEDGAYSFDASTAFSDADLGDTLTYSATLADGSELPEWLTINTETGVLSGTPDNDDVASYDIKVTATDDDGASANDTFALTVDNTNDGPVATDDTAVSAVSVNLNGTDGALIFDSTGDNPELLGGATSIDVTMSISGVADQGQSALLSYASSGSNNEFLIFSDGNHIKLYLGGSDVTSNISSDALYDGTEHQLSVSWDSATGEANFYLDGVLSDTKTIGQGHTIDANGVLNFGQEQDSVGGTWDTRQTFEGDYHDISISTNGTETAHWDMNSIENGVILDSVGNFNLSTTGDVAVSDISFSASEDTTVTIDSSDLLANDTDVDGDTLSITSVNATANTHGTVSLDAEGNIVFTPEADYNGPASFEYTVSDGQGGESTASFTFAVSSVKDAPVVSSAIVDQSTDEDGAYSFDASTAFSDADLGDTLTYSATLADGSELPEWLTINTETGVLSGTPDNDDVASYDIKVTATDDDGASINDTFTLTVDNTNDAVSQVTDVDTDSNAISENVVDGTYTGITLEATDADGQSVTYSIDDDVPFRVEADGRVVVDGDNAIDYETATGYTFDVTATSADGTTSTTSVTVNVDDISELDEDISETTRTITTTEEVLDAEAMEAAGIYERDGDYYQMQETGVVDTAALRDKGYTIDSDGNFFVIDDDAPKTLVTQEVEQEVTRVVDAEPIMKTATEETTYMTVGEAHVDQGTTVGTKDSVQFDFTEPTSNVELVFSNFNTGTSKVSFYDENGDQIGKDINVSQTNGAVGFTVPEGAAGIEVYNGDRSNTFDIDTISYRGEAHEVTVQAGGLVPDYEAMEAAGITWSETESETIVQSADITRIGDVGNNQVDGFNPEDHELSQVFDFGTDLANRMVTITVDMTVSGSWDNNSTSTNDYFSVSANGQEIDVNYYSSSTNTGSYESDDVTTISKNGTDLQYSYDVYLDENGQVQLDFMVASTATDEYVNVSNIEVAYEGQTGWVKEETSTITVEESVLVDAPAQQVDASEIPGGVPMVTEEVQVDPIMKEVTTNETVTDVQGSDGDDLISYDLGENVDGGAGIDTLVMDEAITVDFAAMEDTLQNLEAIDLGNGAQNLQNLSVEDVLDITSGSDDHTLRITGDDSDSVEINKDGDDAEWTKTGSIEGDDGNTYDVYEGTSGGENVTLEIDQNINVSDF